MDNDIESPACDAILAASHPSPEAGGPCETCAFRPGTEANQSRHTMVLARLCVEGVTEFKCHEKTQLCRGWIAAVNLRGAPETEEDKRYAAMAKICADILGDAIEKAAQADKLHELEATSAGRISALKDALGWSRYPVPVCSRDPDGPLGCAGLECAVHGERNRLVAGTQEVAKSCG